MGLVSPKHPQRLVLFLNDVDRAPSGEIKSYFISGAFDNNPEPNSGNKLIGILSRIEFSPGDTLKVSLHNKYRCRGILAKIQQFDDNLTKIYSNIAGWDLAIPEQYNKQVICADRETSDQDAIFIR